MLDEDLDVPASDGTLVVAADDEDERRPPAILEPAKSEGLPKPSDEPAPI